MPTHQLAALGKGIDLRNTSKRVVCHAFDSVQHAQWRERLTLTGRKEQVWGLERGEMPAGKQEGTRSSTTGTFNLPSCVRQRFLLRTIVGPNACVTILESFNLSRYIHSQDATL